MFLCVTVAHAQTIIDFDYVKTFSISNLWIDYNQNEEVEVEEVFMADEFVQCDLYLKYKDFESAGNYLYFTLNIENKKKNKKTHIQKYSRRCNFCKGGFCIYDREQNKGKISDDYYR